MMPGNFVSRFVLTALVATVSLHLIFVVDSALLRHAASSCAHRWSHGDCAVGAIVVADTHIQDTCALADRRLRAIVSAALYASGARTIVHAGDIHHDELSRSSLRRTSERFWSATGAARVLVVPGNHDVPAENEGPNKNFVDLWGATTPWLVKLPGGIRVCGVDTNRNQTVPDNTSCDAVVGHHPTRVPQGDFISLAGHIHVHAVSPSRRLVALPAIAAQKTGFFSRASIWSYLRLLSRDSGFASLSTCGGDAALARVCTSRLFNGLWLYLAMLLVPASAGLCCEWDSLTSRLWPWALLRVALAVLVSYSLAYIASWSSSTGYDDLVWLVVEVVLLTTFFLLPSSRQPAVHPL